MDAVPIELLGRAFTVSDAKAVGVTRRMLQGTRFAKIRPGVYRASETPMTFDLLVRAAMLVLPPDAALSHGSNLRWRGYDAARESPIHFSTSGRLHVERPGLVVHRRQGALSPRFIRGIPVLGADRTFVDVATDLSDRELLRVGDWLVAQHQTDPLNLREYVQKVRLDGVQRARRIAPLVRARVDSVRESDIRWILFEAGLPLPDPNPPIRDAYGVQIAKGDLVYHQFKVLVEHGGWQHERDASQRQRDHLRRERLEADGWLVIVITAADFKGERHIAWRIYNALRLRGYVGPRPTFGR